MHRGKKATGNQLGGSEIPWGKKPNQITNKPQGNMMCIYGEVDRKKIESKEGKAI